MKDYYVDIPVADYINYMGCALTEETQVSTKFGNYQFIRFKDDRRLILDKVGSVGIENCFIKVDLLKFIN